MQRPRTARPDAERQLTAKGEDQSRAAGAALKAVSAFGSTRA